MRLSLDLTSIRVYFVVTIIHFQFLGHGYRHTKIYIFFVIGRLGTKKYGLVVSKTKCKIKIKT